MAASITITEPQVQSLRKLARGWRLIRPKNSKRSWSWIDPSGTERPMEKGDGQPHQLVARGLVKETHADRFMIASRGEKLMTEALLGKVAVLPRKPPGAAKPRPKRKTNRPGKSAPGVLSPVGKCAEHKGRKVRCECGVQFCRTCEPERNGVCAFCEADKRMTRREPSKTFGVEARIALRMGRREGM